MRASFRNIGLQKRIMLYKIRVGQPGAPMPSALVNGWSIQDVLDVLAYIMTLP